MTHKGWLVIKPHRNQIIILKKKKKTKKKTDLSFSNFVRTIENNSQENDTLNKLEKYHSFA